MQARLGLRVGLPGGGRLPHGGGGAMMVRAHSGMMPMVMKKTHWGGKLS
jgi:hypothetical protein